MGPPHYLGLESFQNVSVTIRFHLCGIPPLDFLLQSPAGHLTRSEAMSWRWVEATLTCQGLAFADDAFNEELHFYSCFLSFGISNPTFFTEQVVCSPIQSKSMLPVT